MSNGINVTTTTTIDYYTLGQSLAHQSSADQAAFLDGLAGSLHGLGSIDSYRQIQYISEGVHGYTGWLIEELYSRRSGKATENGLYLLAENTRLRGVIDNALAQTKRGNIATPPWVIAALTAAHPTPEQTGAPDDH